MLTPALFLRSPSCACSLPLPPSPPLPSSLLPPPSQELKAAKSGKNHTPKPVMDAPPPKTLRERQIENKQLLAKHQASMARLKTFEDKLHPKPAGAAEEEKPDSLFYDGHNTLAARGERRRLLLCDTFSHAYLFLLPLLSPLFSGGNLSKDQSRTSHVPLTRGGTHAKDVSPTTGVRTVTGPTSHEKDTKIKGI